MKINQLQIILLAILIASVHPKYNHRRTKINNNLYENKHRDYNQEFNKAVYDFDQQQLQQKQNQKNNQLKKLHQIKQKGNNQFRLKQVQTNNPTVTQEKKEQKKSTTLPPIYGINDNISLTKLKGTLLTNNKFKNDFENENWQDAKYVQRISEYSKNDLKDKIVRRQKLIGVIKNSFIGDKNHTEYPEMQEDVEGQQFTDIMTPVAKTAFQEQLWKDFKTNHYNDVDYVGRKDENIEYVYDLKGNRATYEKVLNQKQVPIHTTSIDVDYDPSQNVLDQVINPLQPLYIDKTLNKDIQYNPNNDIKKQNVRVGLDVIISDITNEMKNLKQTLHS